MPSDGGSDNGIGGNEGMDSGIGSGAPGQDGGYGPAGMGLGAGLGTSGLDGMGMSGADNDSMSGPGPGYAADQQAAENTANSGAEGVNPEGIGDMGFFDKMMQNPMFRGRDIVSSKDPARDAAQFAALKGEISQEQADAYSSSMKADAANLAFSVPGRMARTALNAVSPVVGLGVDMASATTDPNPGKAVGEAAKGAVIGGIASGIGRSIGGLEGFGASKAIGMAAKGLSRGAASGAGGVQQDGNGIGGTDSLASSQPMLEVASAPDRGDSAYRGFAPFSETETGYFG